MIALSRFFLFSSTYLVLLILSSIASAETEYFSMITFLITSLAVGGWLYYLHKIAIEIITRIKRNIVCGSFS